MLNPFDMFLALALLVTIVWDALEMSGLRGQIVSLRGDVTRLELRADHPPTPPQAISIPKSGFMSSIETRDRSDAAVHPFICENASCLLADEPTIVYVNDSDGRDGETFYAHSGDCERAMQERYFVEGDRYRSFDLTQVESGVYHER